MLCESIQASRQRALLVCRGQQQRRFVRKTGVGLLRLAGDGDEAGVILLLIGDVAFDHFQSITRRRFFAGNRSARKIAGLSDAHRGTGRIVLDLNVAILQAGQERAALRQRLRMRPHAANQA